MRYSKYSGRGNFFSLPNEVFLLGLSAGELSVYSFLKRCENRKTHQCWPSIKTIGQAVRMSENTVRKYIRQLEERGLIVTEPTEVITKTGEKRNGNLLFTLRPIQEVIDQYYDRQLEELELATERQRVAKPPAGAGKPRVTACEPLCGPITGGAESLPLPADRGRIWAAVPPFWREGFPHPGLFAEDEKKSRINAGVAGGASGRSHLPAVRAVTGVLGVSKVGSKTGGGYHVCGHNPRTPTAITKK